MLAMLGGCFQSGFETDFYLLDYNRFSARLKNHVQLRIRDNFPGTLNKNYEFNLIIFHLDIRGKLSIIRYYSFQYFKLSIQYKKNLSSIYPVYPTVRNGSSLGSSWFTKILVGFFSWNFNVIFYNTHIYIKPLSFVFETV